MIETIDFLVLFCMKATFFFFVLLGAGSFIFLLVRIGIELRNPKIRLDSRVYWAGWLLVMSIMMLPIVGSVLKDRLEDEQERQEKQESSKKRDLLLHETSFVVTL